MRIWTRIMLALLLSGSVAAARAEPREDFLAALQQAIRADDVAWLADHCDYPVTFRGRRKAVLKTRAAFARRGPALIGADLRADILAQKPADLFTNWQGMMIGSGSRNVWAHDVSSEPDKPDYRIFAVNGAD